MRKLLRVLTAICSRMRSSRSTHRGSAKKTDVAAAFAAWGRFATTCVCGRSMSHARMSAAAPDDQLLAEVKAVIADMPIYGFARVLAVLRHQALADGRQPANRKRVYRVMRVHGLLLSGMPVGAKNAAMTAKLLLSGRTCAGARKASKSPPTMLRGFASPSPSTAATARPWATLPRPQGSRARMFEI